MFEQATKKKSKLRLAIMGVSGSGKTYSALRIATGLGEKIAFIDTEEGSASKYSDRFHFLVKEVSRADVDTLIGIIDYVNQSDIEVLIIDSLSHAWQELLEDIDRLAKTKYQGNSFRAWGEGTPKQKKLVKAILQCKAHVIVTMRAKTEHVQEKDDRGKTIIRKVGTGVEQGKGIEYEFDMLIDLSQEHIAHVTKDRTGKFQDAMIDKPDEKFGLELKNWLDDGIEQPRVIPNTALLSATPETPTFEYITEAQIKRLFAVAKDKSLAAPRWEDRLIKDVLKDNYGIDSTKFILKKDYEDIIDILSGPAFETDAPDQVKAFTDSIPE